MSYDVDKLKDTQLEILNYVVEICETNNISYFLYFGSLLGAIRHNGYIPWDDDLDISCIREDYDRLVDLLIRNQTVNNRFYIQDLRTDPYSPVCHTKIRMNNTECIEKNIVSEEQHKGIFIDIFPLDGYKPGVYSYLVSTLIRLLYSVRGDKLFPQKKHSIRFYLTYPIAHFQIGFYNKWINRLMKSLDTRYSNYLTCYICRYNANKSYICKEWVDKTAISAFENNRYCVPSDYYSVLKSLYGDGFMDLPPLDERITHEYQSVRWFY